MNEHLEQNDAVGRLICARLSGTISPEENAILSRWLDESEENRQAYAEYAALEHRLTSAERVSPKDVEFALLTVKNKTQQKSRWYPAGLIAIAASLVILAVLGIALPKRHTEETVRYCFSNTEATPMNVFLPDGTEVWLRSGAHLEYSSTFNSTDRNVSFSGEAYFNVAHNQDLAFCVITPDFRVRVHGTIFNINTKADAPELVLAQGSVAMQDAAGNNMLRLRPGQKAVWSANDGFFDVTEVPVGNILLLDYGVTSLKNVTAEEIAREIEKQFGVTVVSDGEPDNTLYDFNFQSSSTAGSVVELLNFICNNRNFTIAEQ
ncbi:MAG: FecR domain-containing protein [Bacteroidales bacterium]|nr:FecR domain-containing protein [Bacteroidales bacterium]